MHPTSRLVGALVLVLLLACGGGPAEPPSVWVVTASLPGADPAEVEQLLLLPLERALSSVPGLQRMDGLADEGVATVTLSLSGDDALALREGLQRAALPPDAELPLMIRGGPAQWRVVPLEEAERARYELLAEPGVLDVVAHGLTAEQLVVRLDPARLAAYGIAPGEIAAALEAANSHVTAGAQTEWIVRAVPSQLGDLEQLVVVARDGVPVRLGDVARLERRRADGPRAVSDGAPVAVLEVRAERPVARGRSLDDLTRVDVRAAGDGWVRAFDAEAGAVILAGERSGTAWLPRPPGEARELIARVPGVDAFVRDPEVRCEELVVAADDLDQLDRAVTDLRAGRGDRTWTPWEPARPELAVAADRERLAAYGLGAADVAEAAALVAGRHVATMSEGSARVDVVLKIDAELADAPVGGVPLSAVATLTTGMSRAIPHVDGRRAAVVEVCGERVDPADLPLAPGVTVERR